MKKYKILQTAPGPNFLKSTKHETHNPIKEGDIFIARSCGKDPNVKVRFKMEHNFYSDPDYFIVKVLGVDKK